MGSPEFEIRLAAESDLPAVRQLLVETWHDTYDGLIGTEKVIEITDAWHSVEALAPQLDVPQTSFLVAVLDRQIVGHLYANAQRPPVLVISRLYVLPAFQRRGIGKRLMDTALMSHPHAEVMRLDVEAGNEKGLAFYGREGFQRTGRFSEAGIAHIRMEKRLRP